MFFWRYTLNTINYAKDKDGNKISIIDAKHGEQYFCLESGEPLIVRAENSSKVTKHFARYPSSCTYNDDDLENKMSEWHKAWQNKFPSEYKEHDMEADGEKHRADVFINNTVIEFQHSPITYEDFTKRNRFYLKLGYKIIWVFDASDRIEDSIEEFTEPVAKKANCSMTDLFERSFTWKGCQNQFADYDSTYPDNSLITIYLEAKKEDSEDTVLLELSTIDAKAPKIKHREPCLTPQNFLKIFDLHNIPETLSIKEIDDNTNLAILLKIGSDPILKDLFDRLISQEQQQTEKPNQQERFIPIFPKTVSNSAAMLENQMNKNYRQPKGDKGYKGNYGYKGKKRK